MRKIINSTYITLDGAVGNPHTWPSVGDAEGQADAVQWELLQSCDAMLMGRRTYESFAAVWLTRSGDPLSDRIDAMPKYVVSTALRDPAWTNTTVIRDDVPGELERLNQQEGGHVVQYGIGPVTHTLLEHGPRRTAPLGPSVDPGLQRAGRAALPALPDDAPAPRGLDDAA